MVSDTLGGPTLHAVRRPATNVVPGARARRSAADPTCQLVNTNPRTVASRHVAAAPARHPIGIRVRLELKLVRMSTILLFVSSVGCCWPVLSELRSVISVSPAAASIHPHGSYCQRFKRCRGKADSEIGRLDPFNSAIYAPSAARHVTRRSDTRLGSKSAARIIARERSGTQTRFARHSRPIAVKHETAEAELEAAGPARIARRRGTARGGQPLAHPIQRWRTDKSGRFRDGALPVSR
jgi:hypothetical protein